MEAEAALFEFADGEGLGHVVVGSAVEEGDDIGLAVAHGDDDDGRLGAVADLGEDGGPVAIRKAEVEEDDVRAEAGEGLEPFVARGRLDLGP